MGERYSDRFRKEQATSYDVVELGEIGARKEPLSDRDEAPALDPPDRRPWHGHAGARFALVGTFALGALLGAYGWDRQRDQQAALAELATHNLSVWLNSNQFDGTARIRADVIYRNDGNHPVTVYDFILGDGEAVRTDPPVAITIGPGSEKTQQLNMALKCDDVEWVGGGPAWGGYSSTEPMDVQLDVETADGQRQEAVIPVNMGPDLASWLSWGCESVARSSFDRSGAYPIEIDEVADGPLRVHFEIEGPEGRERVAISGVAMQSPAFQVVLTARDPTSSDSFQDPPVSLDFSVGDCERALVAGEQDLTVVLAGRFEDSEPGQLWVYPQTDLVAALVRLALRECPA